jgi:hypothetical protein
MKKTILAAALAAALPLMQAAAAQAPEQAAAAKPAEAAKPAPKAKAAKATRRTTTAKRHQDARHCLERPNNDAIIRCAEEYL